MTFFPPIPLIRMKRIIKLLDKYKAYSKETAKYLNEIGLINPNGFPRITKRMLDKHIINITEDGKYYINKKR